MWAEILPLLLIIGVLVTTGLAVAGVRVVAQGQNARRKTIEDQRVKMFELEYALTKIRDYAQNSVTCQTMIEPSIILTEANKGLRPTKQKELA